MKLMGGGASEEAGPPVAEFLGKAVEPPPDAAVRNALRLLEAIGALEEGTERLTVRLVPSLYRAYVHYFPLDVLELSLCGAGWKVVGRLGRSRNGPFKEGTGCVRRKRAV